MPLDVFVCPNLLPPKRPPEVLLFAVPPKRFVLGVCAPNALGVPKPLLEGVLKADATVGRENGGLAVLNL